MDKEIEIEAHKAVHSLFSFFLKSMENRLEKKNIHVDKDETLHPRGVAESK